MKTTAITSLAILLVVGCIGASLAQSGKYPMVIVAADGTGDFGPSTPGTLTSGIQEAMNYCYDRNFDLYIKGGATYNISDTIVVRNNQNSSIDGGNYILNWTGPANKDLLFVDSIMDCHYNFGTLVYNGTGAAVRFKPTNPVPGDQLVCIVDSEVKFASVLYSLNPFENTRSQGTGVVMDTVNETCYHAYFYFGAIRNFATGFTTTAGGRGIGVTTFTCPDLRTNVNYGQLFFSGPAAVANNYKLTIGVEPGTIGVMGVYLAGSLNDMDVTIRETAPLTNPFGPFALVIDGNASRNRYIVNSPYGIHPAGTITDYGTASSNQISWMAAPPAVYTRSMESSPYTYTQTVFPATVRLSGGTVSNVKQIRGGVEVDLGASRGDFLLSVGDQLRITGTNPITIQVIPQ